MEEYKVINVDLFELYQINSFSLFLVYLVILFLQVINKFVFNIKLHGSFVK